MGRYQTCALTIGLDRFILTFTREDGTFYAQATGQQRLEIAPTSDSTFRLLAVEASVTFTRGEGGEVEGAILHQNGQDQPATRLEGEAPEEWAPTEDDLADYAGRYYSEELETFYTLAVEEGESDSGAGRRAEGV